MRLGKLSMMGLLAAGSILSTGSAFADSVSGIANIAGQVTVSSSNIDFTGANFKAPSGVWRRVRSRVSPADRSTPY